LAIQKIATIQVGSGFLVNSGFNASARNANWNFNTWEDVMPRVCATGLIAGALVLCIGMNALAQKKYGPGVTDTEIKLGQTMPYSGPLTGLSAVGKVEVAYFEMINSKGGINGRK